MNAPLPGDRPASTRMNPLDALHSAGAIDAALWGIGDAVRKLHAAGWQARGGSVLSIQTPEARAAREQWKRIEDDLEPALEYVLRRVVVEGATILECCHAISPDLAEHAEAILLDRLKLALMYAGRFLTPTT